MLKFYENYYDNNMDKNNELLHSDPLQPSDEQNISIVNETCETLFDSSSASSTEHEITVNENLKLENDIENDPPKTNVAIDTVSDLIITNTLLEIVNEPDNSINENFGKENDDIANRTLKAKEADTLTQYVNELYDEIRTMKRELIRIKAQVNELSTIENQNELSKFKSDTNARLLGLEIKAEDTEKKIRSSGTSAQPVNFDTITNTQQIL